MLTTAFSARSSLYADLFDRRFLSLHFIFTPTLSKIIYSNVLRYFRPRVNSENHFRQMTLYKEGGTIFAFPAAPPSTPWVEGRIAWAATIW